MPESKSGALPLGDAPIQRPRTISAHYARFNVSAACDAWPMFALFRTLGAGFTGRDERFGCRMPIVYDEIMKLKSEGKEFQYTERDSMLYALGIGFMRDPLNEKELPFVYENGLKAVPTMATVIAFGQSLIGLTGVNFLMLVHGEQRLTIHKPLPPFGDIVSDERIVGAYDKGPDKGALIVSEKVIREKDSGEKLCTVSGTAFARGDGGFGGPKEGAPEPHPIPNRAPDLAYETDTRPDQAFLYALAGDRNPLHRDPRVARMAGFPRPILQGLCHLWYCMPLCAVRGVQLRPCENREFRRALLRAGLPRRNNRDRDVGGRCGRLLSLEGEGARCGLSQQRQVYACPVTTLSHAPRPCWLAAEHPRRPAHSNC
jgi:hypothetical protein